MTAVWMENGCERPSYAPIVGSGNNSTTLHYSANDRTMQDGDILLVDAACEYSMYAADITRTVPVNGHFTAAAAGDLPDCAGRAAGGDQCLCGGKIDHQRPRPPGSELARYRGLQLHQYSRKGSARPAAGQVLAAWPGPHDGHRRARSRPIIQRCSSREWSSPSSRASTFPRRTWACASSATSSSAPMAS